MTLSPAGQFIAAAVWHGSLAEAEAILAAHPEVAVISIHTAAILGDDSGVLRFLALDPTSATAKGPHGWDALTSLCFSKYLRIDSARSAAFVRAAEALLDAGASANTGFHENAHQPKPEFESALYGAAGVAHHAEMTRLLLSRGADPNDEEVPYHAPESYDNGALKALVESGKLTADSLATMLLRKADWHDGEGMRYLLEHGADPNRATRWGRTAFQQALRRDNSLGIIELLLDYQASVSPSDIAFAARRGRRDVLELFARRHLLLPLEGVDRLIAACALVDDVAIRLITSEQPSLRSELISESGTLLAEFAGAGNTEGIRCLLDLGVDVQAIYPQGDSYFGIAKESTALHVAAWRAHHQTVKFLIERRAEPNAKDAEGRTPLQLAVKACVDSYWTHRRSTESVKALLTAGASPEGIPLPSGYDEADDLFLSIVGEKRGDSGGL